MKPIYVVIDEYQRDKFEKEWQLPFGYGRGLTKPTFNPKEAITQLHTLVDSVGLDSTTLIVEKVSEEGRELYYRI